MKALIWIGAACGALLCFSAVANDKAAAKPAKAQAVTISAADVKWGPVPTALPAGAQIAVLHGDPFKKNLFALRLKMPDGYRIPAHWHTLDEELTVLSGTFMLAMGDKETDAHALDAGSYHFLPGKMHHSATAKGDVVLELHGMGPFDIHYINPADDPSKTAEAAK
jgi:quercetin dioxygenase-like cupin family protein